MEENNLIIMQGLEGNQPAVLSPVQEAIVPFIPTITIFWWCVWFGALGYVAVQYIVKPLLKK